MLHFLGEEGYVRLTGITLDGTQRLVDGVRAIPGLTILGEPESQCAAIAAVDPEALDVFNGDGRAAASAAGTSTASSRPTASTSRCRPGTAPAVDEFVADLRACVDEVGATRAADRSTDYATLE